MDEKLGHQPFYFTAVDSHGSQTTIAPLNVLRGAFSLKRSKLAGKLVAEKNTPGATSEPLAGAIGRE